MCCQLVRSKAAQAVRGAARHHWTVPVNWCAQARQRLFVLWATAPYQTRRQLKVPENGDSEPKLEVISTVSPLLDPGCALLVTPAYCSRWNAESGPTCASSFIVRCGVQRDSSERRGSVSLGGPCGFADQNGCVELRALPSRMFSLSQSHAARGDERHSHRWTCSVCLSTGDNAGAMGEAVYARTRCRGTVCVCAAEALYDAVADLVPTTRGQRIFTDRSRVRSTLPRPCVSEVAKWQGACVGVMARMGHCTGPNPASAHGA